MLPNKIPEHLDVDIKSIPEERANMISHGLGLILFLIAVPILTYYTVSTGVTEYWIGSLLFGISLIMVYMASTLYHSSYNANFRRKFKIFDHVSIYFLIAGSYSPFILTHLNTVSGWSIFIVLWSMVLIGSIVKLWFVDQFKLISTLAYLVMGWLVLFIIKPLFLALPALSFAMIVVGGVFYTVGVYFYLNKKLKFNHLIWHLFVLGGSVSHFIAVFLCLD